MEFCGKLTTEELKSLCGDKVVKVLRSPISGKSFFTCGSRGGKVSEKGVPQHPTLSICHNETQDSPTQEELSHIGKTVTIEGHKVDDPEAHGYFLLLHEEAESPNLVTTF